MRLIHSISHSTVPAVPYRAPGTPFINAANYLSRLSSRSIALTLGAALFGATLLGTALPTAKLATQLLSRPAAAADYIVDSEGKHAFIQFKVSHLGYGFVLGTFPDFTGEFTYDSAAPETSTLKVDIDTTTVESSHAERNKHILGKDFLHVRKYPTAQFVSTSYEGNGEEGTLIGDLTLRGVTNPVSIAVTKIAEGEDPWGGYRVGFEGTATITMADFGIDYNLGPTSRNVELYLTVEGIRQE